MKTNKKGISPLIATVLIVGFVIVLAGVIWIFARDTIQEQIEKNAAKKLAETTCLSEVKITATDCSSTSTQLIFKVENQGSKMLAGVRARAFDASQSGSTTITHEEDIKQGDTAEMSLNQDLGTVATVEVMPMIMEGGWLLTCPDQAAVINCN